MIVGLWKFFGGSGWRELAHLPAVVRDQIVDNARRRLIQRNRWGLLACGVVNFALTILLFSDVGGGSVVVRFALLLAAGLAMNLMTVILQTRGLRRMIADELRTRKLRPSHCLICGYDLRETPARCPECGTALTS